MVEPALLVAFHKPYGFLSQFTPEPGSKWRTLADLGFPPRLYPIGRLDADSEGLLLLSDEAALNARLISRVSHLIEAVRRAMAQLQIRCPLMIVKGDGTLALAESVVTRPI